MAGTGTGLSLVSRIVAAHEGEVAIESEEGHGTIVKLSLPAHRD
jgi:signal transduction histidine kinase